MTAGEPFGQMPDGASVRRITISGGGLKANVLTYGSVLQDLRLEGHQPPLVLGLQTLDDYLGHSRYFGATAGRCANRIRDGVFQLDGQRHELDRNFLGRHHLHGGAAGIGKRVWQIVAVEPDRVRLAIDLADGEMGYPGAMRIDLTYALIANGTLDIVMEAETDAPTLCNLAHHSYFNLDGGATILDHELRIAAAHYLPVNDELIPTGEVASVDGTPFDFRAGKALRAVCADRMIDHNFCLSRQRGEIERVATLRAPSSGIAMDILTTEPGLQVYDGAKLDVPVPGLDGRKMGAHAGIALEPQVWPDAINNRDFPQAVLRPGERYRQHTQYSFSKEAGR